MKYILTYGRKVNPAQYETVHVEISQEFDEAETPREAGYSDLKTFIDKKVQEVQSTYAQQDPASVEGQTKWRDTKNPSVEWCPEKEAAPQDLTDAKQRKNGMWTMEDERYGVSIFRNKPKEVS